MPESLLKCLTSQREFDCFPNNTHVSGVLLRRAPLIVLHHVQRMTVQHHVQPCRKSLTSALVRTSYTTGNSTQSTVTVVAHSYHALLLLLFEIHYQLCRHRWPIHSMSAVELKISGSLEYSRAERFEVSIPILPRLQCSELRSRYNPLYSHQLSRALPTDTGRWEYRTMDPPYI